MVPDHAWLVTDRRLLPGEDDTTVRRELDAALAEAGVAEFVSVEHVAAKKPALATGADSPAVRSCRAALAGLHRDAPPATVAFATDAGIFAALGIPAVVLGPGSIEQAHTAREFVDVEEVEAMTDVFVRLLETPA